MMEPKIRFKGFEGEWLKRTACNIVGRFRTGKLDANAMVSNGKYRFYTCAKDYFHIDTYAFDDEALLISGNGENVGYIHYYNGKFNAYQRTYVLTDFSQNIFFIKSYLEARLKKRINKEKSIGNTPYIRLDTIRDMEIAISPKMEEQQAIASYFTSLDSQISAATSRLAALKQMKAASLQAMFPQEGETVPKIRFKGFEGEWKKVKFSELYERSSIKNDLSFGEDKIISVANMFFIKNSRQVDDDYLRSYNIMRLGDIAFEGHSSKEFAYGRFVENTIGDGIVSHVFVVMKPISKKYDLYFWKYYINNENIMGRILSRCTKSSTMMNDIVVDDFLKESILVPSYGEQIEIGKILTSLDRQISLQSQRLEKLKQIKSACLDKMFV